MVSRRRILLISVAFGAALLRSVASFSQTATNGAPADPISFATTVQPLLERYCYSCHGNGKSKGDLALDQYRSLDITAFRKDRKVWQSVLDRVRSAEMPPRNQPQPSLDDRDRITRWIDAQLFPCDCNHPDPGRVTVRRLNRTEYNNTVRDLVGVDLRPADDFPADDVGYGFDNIGDVLSMPPILFERYFAAAEKVISAALRTNQPPEVPEPGRPAGQLEATAGSHGRQRIVFCRPSAPSEERDCAEKILARFADRAFRRPASDREKQQLLALYDLAAREGARFEEAIRVPLEAVLVSPHFLFRGEVQPSPDQPRAVHPLDDYSLASRLSYFLWSTMPDDELLAEASRGSLRRNLEAQVHRMLSSPKAQALVDNFALQWLQVRNIRAVAPDRAEFPEFDKELRAAMEQETALFCAALMREDRSVLELLTADYTFLNERLARHYQIPNVQGPEFRRVSLAGTPRGGVLTHGSILTITSNPTRTSPVKRGKWVLENFLNAPPPPPPPNVPELKSAKELTGTLRQRLEQHRENALCASCHDRMDPLGFGLENFNAVGGWRDKDGSDPVDASGQLTSGEKFQGPTELRRILASSLREPFVRCLTEKALTYALGRGLEYYDRCAVDAIVKELGQHNYQFSHLILGIARSAPFQLRRGEGDPTEEVASAP